MQFRDLKKQYSVLKEDIDKAMLDVASSGQYINGPWVKELESQLADYVGVKHCITCGNGTDALSIALMTWGIGPGDVVFVPDFTFFASGETVSHVGAKPVFVDVEKDTFNISAESLEKAVDKAAREGVGVPKAIIAVDLFGLPADFYSLRKVADKFGLLILEDGAQGFGGEINGKKACSFGDISTTSFFPAKPLGCYGDGGAVFTDCDEIAALAQSLCVHGKGLTKYDNVRIGLNSRLDSIQAAILQEKLKAFKEYELNDVNHVAIRYNETLSALLGDKVHLPYVPEGFVSSWAQYTIRFDASDERDSVKEHLMRKNIPSMVYYPKPMHCQKAFGIDGEYKYDCSNTTDLCGEVLSLPIHPYMTEKEIIYVADSIAEVLL